MDQITQSARAKYVSATGYSCITSGGAALIGVLCQGSATCGFQIFTGNTATGSTAISGLVRAYVTTAATAQQAVWFPFPADLPTGFCVYNQDTLDPKITLFWQPLSPNTP